MKITLIVALASLMLIGCADKSDKKDLPPPKAESTATATAGSDKTSNYDTKPPSSCNDQLYKARYPVMPSVMTGESQTLCFNGFVVLYSAKTKTPLYSASQLTTRRIQMAEQIERVDSFHPEKRLGEKSPTLESYKNSGYDRGHLAPNADMYNKASQYDSFSLANIAPQAPKLNRGAWANLESNVRSQTKKLGESYVVTGTLYKGESVKSLKGVIVPSHFYKAVYYPKNKSGSVYVAPNINSGSIQTMTYSQFKSWSQIDVFPDLTKD